MNLNYKSLFALIKSTLNQDYKTFKSKNRNLTQEVLFDEDNNILKSYINSNKKDLLHVLINDFSKIIKIVPQKMNYKFMIFIYY